MDEELEVDIEINSADYSRPVTEFDPSCHHHFEGVIFSTGPSPNRDHECGICLEDMKPDDKTLTHVACHNTFHEKCLNDAILFDHQNFWSSSCPMCRSSIVINWPNTSSPRQLRYWLEREHFHEVQDVLLSLVASTFMDPPSMRVFTRYWEDLKPILAALRNPSRARYRFGIVFLCAVQYAYSPESRDRNTQVVDNLDLMSATDIDNLTEAHCLSMFCMNIQSLIRVLRRHIEGIENGLQAIHQLRFLQPLHNDTIEIIFSR